MANRIKTLETDLKKEREMRITLERRLTTLENKLTNKSSDTSLGNPVDRTNNMETNSNHNDVKHQQNIVTLRSTVKTIREQKTEIWNERNKQTEFKLLNLESSISTVESLFAALPAKTAALLKKSGINKIEFKENVIKNTDIKRRFHVISCTKLNSIARLLFSKEINEELLTRNIILKRQQGNIERRTNSKLVDHLKKSSNPGDRFKLEPGILRRPGGDFYYDYLLDEVLPLSVEVNNLLTKKP